MASTATFKLPSVPFLNPTGHDNPDVERIIELKSGYAVIEKFGESGAAAVRLDPRKRESTEEAGV